MDHLRVVCLKKISLSLTKGNVCKMAKIALFYEEEELIWASKNALIHNWQVVEGTEEFETLRKEKADFVDSAFEEAAARSRRGHYGTTANVGAEKLKTNATKQT